MVPGQPATYGISKRLPDDERRRLRKVLDGIRPAAGLIVRTAAEGATPEELERDLRASRTSGSRSRASAPAKPAKLLYKEPPLVVRVIREEFTKEYRSIVIDDPALYEDVKSYVEAIAPELAERVELYDDPDLPVFERFHVHEQLHKALDRKVWLPVGRVAHHRAHRGAHGDRREHRQERREVEPRGDRLREQPRGGRRDRAPAPAARHRRDHRHRLHRHGDQEEPRRGDPGVPRGAGPRQDPDPGVRHLRARAGRDDPQADLGGAGRGVLRDLSRLCAGRGFVVDESML